MKNDYSLFIGLELFIIAIILIFTFSSCSNQNTMNVVCDYGAVVCDISTTLCYDIPGVPDEVCTYLNLACYNLDQICLYRDSTQSTRYQVALTNLQNITFKFKQWKLARDKTK